MSLDEYLQMEIEETNKFAGQELCKYAVVLMDKSCIDDIEMTKAEKRLLIYDDNRAEVLKQLCEDPTKWRTRT